MTAQPDAHWRAIKTSLNINTGLSKRMLTQHLAHFTMYTDTNRYMLCPHNLHKLLQIKQSVTLRSAAMKKPQKQRGKKTPHYIIKLAKSPKRKRKKYFTLTTTMLQISNKPQSKGH